MKRGDLYRVENPGLGDPKKFRVFAIVSRQALIDSRYSSVVCAPVFSAYHGISTQVPIGIEEGLRHESAIHCDSLMSLLKSKLTHFVGALSPDKIDLLNEALRTALDVTNE